MSNPISGHTAAQNTGGQDGLRDGDVITSPSITNALEAAHGNGVLRLHDSAYGSTRNIVDGVEGSVSGLAGFALTIQGGYCVLDGALYQFGGGPGDTVTLTLGAAGEGTGTALGAAAEQSVYAIFLAAEGGLGGATAGHAGIHYAGGTPIDATTGVYPTLPEQYLHDYDGVTVTENEQVIVLAVVRCKHNAANGLHQVEVVEINDKRVFIRPNPLYLIPLSTGGTAADSATKQSQIARGGGDGVNNATDLRSIHAANEGGDIGNAVGAATDLHDIGALWLSTAQFGTAGNTPPVAGTDGFGYGPSQGNDRTSNPTKDVLYFASQVNDAASVETARLSARGVDARALSQNYGGAIWNLTPEGDQVFVLVPDGTNIILNPNPTSDFPEGHIVEIRNDGGAGTITFDSLGISESIAANQYGRFVYEGSAWLKLIKQAVL